MGSERRELVGLLARELAFFDELGNVQRDLHRAPPTLDPRWRDDITNSGVTSASGTFPTSHSHCGKADMTRTLDNVR